MILLEGIAIPVNQLRIIIGYSFHMNVIIRMMQHGIQHAKFPNETITDDLLMPDLPDELFTDWLADLSVMYSRTYSTGIMMVDTVCKNKVNIEAVIGIAEESRLPKRVHRPVGRICESDKNLWNKIMAIDNAKLMLMIIRIHFLTYSISRKSVSKGHLTTANLEIARKTIDLHESMLDQNARTNEK